MTTMMHIRSMKIMDMMMITVWHMIVATMMHIWWFLSVIPEPFKSLICDVVHVIISIRRSQRLGFRKVSRFQIVHFSLVYHVDDVVAIDRSNCINIWPVSLQKPKPIQSKGCSWLSNSCSLWKIDVSTSADGAITVDRELKNYEILFFSLPSLWLLFFLLLSFYQSTVTRARQ